MLRHGVRRLPGGGLQVTIDAAERDALRSLPAQLRPIVSGEADTDLAAAVRTRLFPAAYAEPDLDEEFRRLVGSGLVEQRMQQLDAFSRTLAAGRETLGRWQVELGPDEAHAWLAVVNDTRLTLGALLGITDEREWEGGPDEDDPASVMLWYLGWLEEELVRALMGSLPE